MISRKSQLILTGGAALGLTLTPASGAFTPDASSTEAPAPAATTSTSPAATTSTPSATSTAASSTPTATPTAAASAPAAADGDAADQKVADAESRVPDAQQKVADAQAAKDAADAAAAPAQQALDDAVAGLADAEADPAAAVTDPALSAEITTRTTESTVLTTQAHRVADADEVIAPLDAQTAADAALQAAQKALADAQAALVAAPEDLDRKAAVDKALAADDAAIVIWDNPYDSINPGFWYGHDYFEQDLQAYESTVVAGTTDPTLKAAREAVVDTYRAWDAAQIDYVNAWFGAGATAGQREAVDTTKAAYLAAVDALNTVEPAYPQAYVDAKAALDNAHLQTLIAQYDADGAQVRVIWDVATLKLIKGAAELKDLDTVTSAAGEAQTALDTVAPAQN